MGEMDAIKQQSNNQAQTMKALGTNDDFKEGPTRNHFLSTLNPQKENPKRDELIKNLKNNLLADDDMEMNANIDEVMRCITRLNEDKMREKMNTSVDDDDL